MGFSIIYRWIYLYLGGGFKYVVFSPLNLGKIPILIILTYIFSNGLKPPPIDIVYMEMSCFFSIAPLSSNGAITFLYRVATRFHVPS